MKEFIERSISSVINEAAQYFPVICITGPRQSGKSTLINHLFANYKRFSMEDYAIRNIASTDPVAFLNQTEGGMVIDEIQQLPELMSYIQGIVDMNPNRKFVISGSSNFMLLKNVSQSLAGRAGVFELLPMSFTEVSEWYNEKTLDEILFNGLYPAVCSEKNIARFLYPAYTKTYIDKDVRDIVNVSSLSLFHTFLRLCAARIGSIFNASELASEVGVSSHTIASWLSILEASYIVVRLQPWFENTRKRLTRSPKLYFCDTGLACYLLDIESPEQLSRDKMRGHLFENFIVMEALKARYNQGKDNNLFFFRDAKGSEIDLLQHVGGTLKAIEIKSSQTYSTSFADALRKCDTLLNTKVVSRDIIYAGDYEASSEGIGIHNFRHFRFDCGIICPPKGE